MSKASTLPPWRIIAAEIIAATKADPDSLRSIYDDREFRPSRKASVWVQFSARLAQARKAYREAVAKGCMKEVQHNMLRRCFAHDYTQPGEYMITLVVPQRGSNPFGTVKGDIRQNRTGITVMPDALGTYAALPYCSGPLRLELTPLAASMLQALEGITTNYPMVLVRKAQIMPDHLHLILEVTAPIVSSKGTPRHLGHVIAGYKAGCNKARRLLIAQCATPSSSTIGVVELCSNSSDGGATIPDPTFAHLWAEGYTDTIILSRTHMATEEAYLDDNIYRLRMKQLHRDLFRIVHHIRINGNDFAALGNINLLRKPMKEQVQYHHWEQDVPAGYRPCDRSWNCQRFYAPAQQGNTTIPAQGSTTPLFGSCAVRIYTLGTPIQGPTEADAHTERLLKAGDEGAVFVSPFISETEKALRDAALTMGIPYIRLTREGFRDLYTPTKSEFEACCEGNLLLLAPWEDRKRTSTITRHECMELNDLSKSIAYDDLKLTLVNDNDRNNDTIIPRDDE